MENWARIFGILAVWGLIEWVDSLSEGINLPWWMSLLMACFCSFIDIIVIFLIDLVSD